MPQEGQSAVCATPAGQLSPQTMQSGLGTEVAAGLPSLQVAHGVPAGCPAGWSTPQFSQLGVLLRIPPSMPQEGQSAVCATPAGQLSPQTTQSGLGTEVAAGLPSSQIGQGALAGCPAGGFIPQCSQGGVLAAGPSATCGPPGVACVGGPEVTGFGKGPATDPGPPWWRSGPFGGGGGAVRGPPLSATCVPPGAVCVGGPDVEPGVDTGFGSGPAADPGPPW
jgi:hypothetical protein